MMSTYLAKERYYFTRIVEIGVARQEFKKVNANYFIIQLKGLLSMPFLNSQYLSEVLHVFPHEKYFADKYLQEIFDWLESVLVPKKMEPSQYSVTAPYMMKRVPLYRTRRVPFGGVSGATFATFREKLVHRRNGSANRRK